MSAFPVEPSPPDLRLADTPAPSKGPLSETDINRILRSAKLARPIRKAERFATGNGWLTLLAACATVPFAIGDMPTLIFAVILGAIGTRELTLRRRLHLFEPRVTRKLALNQVLLGALLASYAIVKMIQSASGPGMISSTLASDPMLQSAPEMSSMLDRVSQIERLATIGIYIILLFVAMLVQGGSALYYLLKGRALHKFHEQTPDWVIRVHHAVDGHF